MPARLFFFPMSPLCFLWWEVDKRKEMTGRAMRGKKGEEQVGPSGDCCVSTPAPWIPPFWRLTLGGKKVTQISPLSCLSLWGSLFSWYFTGWHLGQGPGLELWNLMGFWTGTHLSCQNQPFDLELASPPSQICTCQLGLACFCSTGHGTQGVTHAGQGLCCALIGPGSATESLSQPLLLRIGTNAAQSFACAW